MAEGDVAAGSARLLHELLDLYIEKAENEVPCLYATLLPAVTEEAALALAVSIAVRRLPNPTLLDVWRRRATGEITEAPGDVQRRVLEASLLENVGTPTEPAPTEHLHGLVAEAIWLSIVTTKPVALGRPIKVEGHEWSVTDPGGDGLTIYAGTEGYRYRLWESKYHGQAAPIAETVGDACRQLRDRAMHYLARFSAVAQQRERDESLAAFYVQLAEL